MHPEPASVVPGDLAPRPRKRGKVVAIVTAFSAVVAILVAVGGVFAVKAVSETIASAGGGAGAAEESPSPTEPNGTTEYHRLEEQATSDPIAGKRVALELPPAEGFTGGRTVISTPQDSAWEWKAMPAVDNENLYGGQMGTLYGGIGLCTSFVGLIRDQGDTKDRWAFTDEAYGRWVVLTFKGALGVDNPADYAEDEVAGLPYHAEGLGEIPFFQYTVPASKNNTGYMMKVLEGPDYNTGYITFLTVACMVPSDTDTVYDLMTTSGNEYSVYVDVLPPGQG